MIKTCTALLLIFLLPGQLWAQHVAAARLPEAVRAAFKNAQPLVTKVSWHQRGAVYEARFRQPQGWGALLLTPAGELVETQTDIPSTALPPLGRMAISQQFPKRQLDQITKVVKASGETTYVVQVCKGKNKNGKDRHCQTSVFDANGRPVAK